MFLHLTVLMKKTPKGIINENIFWFSLLPARLLYLKHPSVGEMTHMSSWCAKISRSLSHNFLYWEAFLQSCQLHLLQVLLKRLLLIFCLTESLELVGMAVSTYGQFLRCLSLEKWPKESPFFIHKMCYLSVPETSRGEGRTHDCSLQKRLERKYCKFFF